jgi:ABC-type nickel/cobalt efflux system permease component RcnA
MMASLSLLLLGLLLGIRHATEADHLAAVASLATRTRGLRATVAQGVAWGLGHTLMLLAVGGVCLLVRATIPERVAAALEAAVGVMLLYLGADVLWRWRRRRIHVHVHRHEDGTVHLHAHGHAPGEGHHEAHAHAHEHPHRPAGRAVLVGLVHGLAGSAALLLVTLSTLSSAWLGLAYIAVFGAGSILGMAALSAVVALPLNRPGRALTGRLTDWHNGLEAAIGLSTLAIGAWVLYNTPWGQALHGRLLGS